MIRIVHLPKTNHYYIFRYDTKKNQIALYTNIDLAYLIRRKSKKYAVIKLMHFYTVSFGHDKDLFILLMSLGNKFIQQQITLVQIESAFALSKLQ